MRRVVIFHLPLMLIISTRYITVYYRL